MMSKTSHLIPRHFGVVTFDSVTFDSVTLKEEKTKVNCLGKLMKVKQAGLTEMFGSNTSDVITSILARIQEHLNKDMINDCYLLWSVLYLPG